MLKYREFCALPSELNALSRKSVHLERDSVLVLDWLARIEWELNVHSLLWGEQTRLKVMNEPHTGLVQTLDATHTTHSFHSQSTA